MLNKVNYIPNETIITAENLNDIQDEIIGNSEELNNIKTLINKLYPVGSIYISATSTSPASFIGGVWEQIKDKFLLAAGDSYANGATGGGTTVNLSHSHTTNAIALTEAQLPHITGDITMHSAENNGAGSHWWTPQGVFSKSPTHSTYCAPAAGAGGAHSISGIHFEIGSNQPHGHGDTSSSLSSSQSIMPPYLAVYIWKRVS